MVLSRSQSLCGTDEIRSTNRKADKTMKHLTAICVLALGCSALLLGCDPPPTDDAADDGEPAASEDGPAGLDYGGIDAVPDDPDLIAKGEELFQAEGCAGCHQMDTDGAGPALGGVTDKRSAPWLSRMIMHPHEMVDQDPTAAEISDDFPAPMLETNLTFEEVEALIAYLGTQ